MLQRPKLSDGFREEIFIGKICGEGCRVRCQKSLSYQPSAFSQRRVTAGAQLEVAILQPDGSLSSGRAEIGDNLCSLPLPTQGGRAGPMGALLFFLPSLTLLNSNCLNLAFGTGSRSRKLKVFSPISKKREHRKVFMPERALKGPAGFHYFSTL